MNLDKFSLKWENLELDWISLNIQGLPDPLKIGSNLSRYFWPDILINGGEKIGFHGLNKKYKVSIIQSTSKTSGRYWVGTQIVFSGKNAAYFYRLIKSQKFDWSILMIDKYPINLGRIDLCFCRINNLNDTIESLDAFLVSSRDKVKKQKKSRYFKLEDFPSGKMLKVNRRNNGLHYRVYKKGESVRFELELKHGQTRLLRDFLFNNELDVFENQLVIKYFKSFQRVVSLDFQYTDWIVDFQRRCLLKNIISPVLVTSYFGNQIISQKDEERLFHLLQFLSFVKSLNLKPDKNLKKDKIKKQNYYNLKFPLSQFVEFIGTKISNQSQRDKLIQYFKQLQTLDPIVKEFSDRAFRSYVCFPYVECENRNGNGWILEVLVVEELFYFMYPFNFPDSFLGSNSKNDLRLKVFFIKSLSVSGLKKTLDIEEFFKKIKLPNNTLLVSIKKIMLQLLNELSENKFIHNEVEILLKSGRARNMPIKDLTISDITRRIKYIKLYETVQFLQ